jgi:tetraacyldisaccharide 4'-kinase
MEKRLQHIRSVALSEGEIPTAYRPAMAILSGLSAIYGGVQKIHSDIYMNGWSARHRLACTVISIGNLAAGGTGKTPMTEYVARLCQGRGYKTAVLSRGYKGRAERCGGVVSDGHQLLMTPEVSGDEPFMLAVGLAGTPVLVGKDRYQSGRLAIDRFAPDIIILDDGFQHLKLERDLDILLLDGHRPFGNGHLLPRGLLREPLSAIRRADVVVLTRSEHAQKSSAARSRYFAGKPVFRSSHQPEIEGILPAGQRPHLLDSNHSGNRYRSKRLCSQRIFAFSGIAQNDSFHQSITQLGGHVIGHMDFSDHFTYQDADLAEIGHVAVNAGADCLATTAKDYARMANQIPFPLDLVVVNVKILFLNDRFDHFLLNRLEEIIQSKKNLG